MQITLNKVPFDVAPVAAPLRAALLADPAVARARVRDVWAWDKDAGTGRHLVPVAPDGALPLPPGLLLYVQRPGLAGGTIQKADGPTARMAERLLAAVGAKSVPQLLQAMARLAGLPRLKVPLEAFAALDASGPYAIRMETDFAAVELANAARNLQAYLVLPALVAFSHVMEEPPEGAPAPGAIRPGFAIPPATQAALAMRRMAVAQRLNELQADLDGAKPADLPAEDPRRGVAARLGAEWRVLQPKPAKAA